MKAAIYCFIYGAQAPLVRRIRNKVVMQKKIIRAYSQYSHDAAALLGSLIHIARKNRGLTAQDTADRVGISRGLLHRIEKGGLKCEMGAVFEVAALLGIRLFDAEPRQLSLELRHAQEKIALLPSSVRCSTKALDDDF